MRLYHTGDVLARPMVDDAEGGYGWPELAVAAVATFLILAAIHMVSPLAAKWVGGLGLLAIALRLVLRPKG